VPYAPSAWSRSAAILRLRRTYRPRPLFICNPPKNQRYRGTSAIASLLGWISKSSPRVSQLAVSGRSALLVCSLVEASHFAYGLK